GRLLRRAQGDRRLGPARCLGRSTRVGNCDGEAGGPRRRGGSRVSIVVRFFQGAYVGHARGARRRFAHGRRERPISRKGGTACERDRARAACRGRRGGSFRGAAVSGDVDGYWMALALEVARRASPLPNPRVGAVVVAGYRLVSVGWHACAGGDHAEVAALA